MLRDPGLELKIKFENRLMGDMKKIQVELPSMKMRDTRMKNALSKINHKSDTSGDTGINLKTTAGILLREPNTISLWWKKI